MDLAPPLFFRVFLAFVFNITILEYSVLIGAGFPNETQSQLFEQLAIFNDSNQSPRGQGVAGMHRGYLFVPFGGIAGGGGGTGGFTFYDVSNPRAPEVVFTTLDNSLYDDPTDADYTGNFREQHTYAFSGDVWCGAGNHNQNYASLQFWDFSDPAGTEISGVGRPIKLSEVKLSGLPGGNYDGTAWWLAWQGGRYVYVAGTSGGLYIIDASDFENPVELKRIPTGQLGNFRVNTVFAVGNLLVIAQSDGNGIATLDISDPLNPQILDIDTTSSAQVGYSMMVNGGRIYGGHDPARVFSISEFGQIQLIGTGPDIASKGGYGMIQDDEWIYGSSNRFVKLNVSKTPFSDATSYQPTGISDPDWDFASVIGNLLFLSNDHEGSMLLVHQQEADLNPPLVNMVNPYDESVNQAITSRVGVTLSDQIRTESINQSSFIVRPLGGEALPGRYSNQTGIINFWPDEPLEESTTYEVVLPSGGILDLAGNGLGETFISRFSTGETLEQISVTIESSGAVEEGEVVAFIANVNGMEDPEYRWELGDGTETEFSENATLDYRYAIAGNYNVLLRVRSGDRMATASKVQTIHRPLTAIPPKQTSSILYDSISEHIWNVNPDNDSVTVVDANTYEKLAEIPVGKQPEALTLGVTREIWVANSGSGTVSIIDADNLQIKSTINLPRGSKPFGVVFSPNGDSVWVSLSALGYLYRYNAQSRELEQFVELGAGIDVRSMAVTSEGNRLYVNRFISPDSGGEIYLIDVFTGEIVDVLLLELDPGPDTEASGRGLPNYLGNIAISPDGVDAWWAGKKDNIERGLSRDGLPLNFESTVRSIAGKIILDTGIESMDSRIDFNDKGIATAVRFNPLGNYLFVGTQGTHSIEVIDPYTATPISTIETGGKVVKGIAINDAGTRLFVHCFLSREVRVFSIGNLCENSCQLTQLVEVVSTVSNESLHTKILKGKQLFYEASDSRLNRDNYISCAACHQDGGHDGRTWDFTDRGEGLRNTIDLRGRGGIGHGFVHWSANFDEIQDFEHDIRGSFGGSGLMTDSAFNTGTRSTPLGDTKAGTSVDLDALAAYVESLTEYDPSPYRNSNGSLSHEALQGEQVFNEMRCGICHFGSKFSDSPFQLLHDIGTMTSESGLRLGSELFGIDTPTLIGLWSTAPYLHDGSASSLLDVLTLSDPLGIHTAANQLSEDEKLKLISYLLQIESGSENQVETRGIIDGSMSGKLNVASGEFHTHGIDIHEGFEPIEQVSFRVDDTLIAYDQLSPYQYSYLLELGDHQLFTGIEFSSGIKSTAYRLVKAHFNQLIDETFEGGLNAFSFQKNTFINGNSSELAFRSNYSKGVLDEDGGVYLDNAIKVILGGNDSRAVTDVSGGYVYSFFNTEAKELMLKFLYRLVVSDPLENSEYGEVRISIDGKETRGFSVDSGARIAGGGDSGWREVALNLGEVTAGSQQLILGAFLNAKTASDETVECWFDNIRLSWEGSRKLGFANYFSAEGGGDQSSGGDFNSDGVINLFAYAMGSDPNEEVFLTDFMTEQVTSEGIGIVFKRNPFLSDLRYRVEQSKDLLNWREIYSSETNDSLNNMGDYMEILPVDLDGAIDESTFLRLKLDLNL